MVALLAWAGPLAQVLRARRVPAGARRRPRDHRGRDPRHRAAHGAGLRAPLARLAARQPAGRSRGGARDVAGDGGHRGRPGERAGRRADRRGGGPAARLPGVGGPCDRAPPARGHPGSVGGSGRGRRLLRAAAPRRPPACGSARRWRPWPRWRRSSALLLRPSPPGPPAGLAVSFLDVGQGDATLVQHGARTVLVDAGPADGPILARLREAGVGAIDVLVVTHAQADHEGRRPGRARAPPREAAARRRGRLARARPPAAAGAGARSRRAPAGPGRGAGPARRRAGGRGCCGRTASRPPRTPVSTPTSAPWSRWSATAPFDLLLTADAESDVTAPLALRPVDALKVAHHGSADPGLPTLLRRLRPSVAAIEVGRDNPYGHPDPTTLHQLAAVPHVYRTDRDGTIRVTVEGGRLRVRTAR